MYWVESNDSWIFEKIDTLIMHWIPSNSKMYINSGLISSIKSKNPELNPNELVQLIKNEIKEVLGFDVLVLEQMNDDYEDNLKF
jgi:hypothetical protein